MRLALKRVAVPALRQRGFTGELPHLRRLTPEATHTFTVQTSKWGGEFIVELGRAPAGPYATATGEEVQPRALRSYHLRDADRARLRSVPNVLRETRFRYAPGLGDRLRGALGALLGRAPADPCDRAAHQVLALLPECDRWWAGENGLPHVRGFAEQFVAQGGKAPAGSEGP